MNLEEDPLFILAKNEKRAYETIFNDINKTFGIYSEGYKSFTVGQHFFNREVYAPLGFNRQVSTNKPIHMINVAAAALANFVAPREENSITIRPLESVLTPTETTEYRKDEFFENAGRILQKMIMNPANGFHAHLKECITQLLLYGNSAMMINCDHPLQPIFQTIDFREVFIYYDDKGILKKIWRQFAVRDGVDEVKRHNQRTQEYTLIERENDAAFRPMNGDALVLYKLYDEEGKIIEEEELTYWPIVTTRLFETAGNQYGSGLGLLMLPHADRLNILKKMLLSAGHLQIQPPLQMVANNIITHNFTRPKDKKHFGNLTSSDYDIADFILNPGQIVAVKSAEPTISPILQSSDLAPFELFMQQEEQDLREIAMLDVLMLSDLSGSASVEEVEEKISRKMHLLSPLVSSVQKILNGVVLKVFYSALNSKKKGLFTSNYEVTDASLLPLDIQYENHFTRLPEFKKSRGLAELAMKLGNLAQIDPAFLDSVNVDKLVKDMLRLDGYGYLIASEEEIEAKRESRASQQEQQ